MLPFYYSDSDDLSFLPFWVAHIELAQNRLIIGPESISKYHDEFITKLYFHISDISINKIAIRNFIIDSKLCFALIIPTGLTDKGGRGPLRITIGFLIRPEFMNLPNSVFTYYLKLMIDTLNYSFSLSLPDSGADKLHHIIRNEINEIDNYKISMAVDFIIKASQILKEIPIKKYRRNLFNLFKFKKTRKVPKIIYYHQEIMFDDLINLFLNEVLNNIKNIGITGLQEIFSDENEYNIGQILIIPMPNFIKDIKEAKLNKWRKKEYLCIY